MKKKILIIDDDTVVAQTYSLKLRSEEFETSVAGNGPDGLALLPVFNPHLIILDLMLPGISGLDVLASLRKEPQHTQTPVLLLSNHYLQADSNPEIAMGLTRSLVKAETTPSKVLEVINEMLAVSDRAEPNLLQLARAQFCRDVVQAISPMRLALQSLARARGPEPEVSEACAVIKSHAEVLTSAAADLALSRISHLASALSGLAQQLAERASGSTPSTSRTIAGALDALDRLVKEGITAENRAAPLALVVEDELVSQTIVRTALDRSQVRSIVTSSGEFALTLLESNPVDVIFLDVTLPGINGYEVCTALRKLPLHAATPVIFITGLKEFEARARSILSGANDLIAKPASVSELAVKALTQLLKMG